MIRLTKEQIENAPEFMAIEGYEGLYEVGKDGTVWSLNYQRTGQRKKLTPAPYDKLGHLLVTLCKDGKQKTRLVHQLVLNAYLPKPSEDLVAMHLDSEPTNNRLNNLAWGTCKENSNDPHRIALITNRKDLSIPVLCVETGTVYPSVCEVERQTGVHHSSISNCINGKRKTAGGCHWAKFTDYQ